MATLVCGNILRLTELSHHALAGQQAYVVENGPWRFLWADVLYVLDDWSALGNPPRGVM